MSADIVEFDGFTKLDIPAERVLRKALEQGLESAVIIGYDRDGDEYFAASIADGGTVLWLLERCKAKLLAVPETHFGDSG